MPPKRKIYSQQTNNLQSTFKFFINQNYQLKCVIYDSRGVERVIRWKNNPSIDFYPITIAFDMNEIFICQDTPNSIDFMKDWITNPNDFKLYTINYQNKQYSVIAEVLFAIIMYGFKNKAEKQYIIKSLKYVTPSNQIFIDRMKVALDSIGLYTLDDNDSIPDFDYQSQGDILHFIIEKCQLYYKLKKKLNYADKVMKLSPKNHLLTFDNTQPFNENILDDISKQFSTKERSQMKLCDLDNYCIFIASKFFDTIKDHINLVKTCKRLQYNMTKFHFNPLSLTENTIHFFPSIQTLFLYNYNDYTAPKKKSIISRVKWYYNLTQIQIEQIQKMNSMKFGKCLFDTMFDDWTNSDTLNNRILLKRKLLFVVEDETCEKFGYYFDTTVQCKTTEGKKVDTNDKTFHFNISSRNRLTQPMKFPITNCKFGGIGLYHQRNPILIELGNIVLYTKDYKNDSYCYQNTYNFDYKRIPNALCGKTKHGKHLVGQSFKLSRLVVIQME